MAAALMGDGRASPARAQVVMGLMGSRGLGPTGLSAVDATPAGAVLDMQQAAQHGDKAGMAMAAAGFVPGAKVAEKVAAKVAEAAPAASKGIIAYHGSPHSFDRFDLSKIGTGEGAQAYGHGLYFADSENVAKEYRDRLSDGMTSPPRWFIKGAEAAQNSPEAKAASIVKALGPAKASKFAQRTISEFSADPRMTNQLAFWKQVDGILSQGIGKRDVSQKYGHMYQVRINADPDHFLDWDRPLSEQPVVRDKLMRYVFPDTAPMATSAVEARGGASIANKPPVRNSSATAGVDNSGISIAGAVDGPTLFNDYTFDAVRTQDGFHPRVETPNGQRIYRDVTLPSRTEAEAAGRSRVLETVARPQNAAESQFLNAAGIPGIKYLDQGSRGTSGGELLDVFQGPNGWQSRIKVSGRGGAGFLTPTDSVTTSKPFASEADARAWADSKINSGSRNYVVFDDKIIEIMRKYGLAGSAGAAMAAEILQRQNGGQPQGQAVAPAM